MITKHNQMVTKKIWLIFVLILISLLAASIAGCAGAKSPLTMTVSQPVTGANITASPFEVLGIVSDPKATVTVNGIEAAMAPGGHFGYNISLTEGENTINVVATRGEATVTKTLKVTYTTR